MKPAIDFNSVQQFARKNWFQVTIIALLLYVFFKRDLAFQIQVQAPGKTEQAAPPPEREKMTERRLAAQPGSTGSKLEMPFIGSQTSKRDAAAELTAIGESTRQAYLERFLNVALKEQEKFGIPASVILATALHQSAAGKRDLALPGSNNHFALPCTARWGGKCQRFQGRDYRQYDRAWASFRDFSVFLNENFPNLKGKDYKTWAKSFASAGFGEDDNLAKNLISIIERYRLNAVDGKR
jgi:flagellum-specific peptidoglycan hydrolase FlgJ